MRPDGGEVLVNDALVGVAPLDLEVAAGELEVVIQCPGFVARRQRLTLAIGAAETIADELLALPTSGRRKLSPWDCPTLTDIYGPQTGGDPAAPASPMPASH